MFKIQYEDGVSGQIEKIDIDGIKTLKVPKRLGSSEHEIISNGNFCFRCSDGGLMISGFTPPTRYEDWSKFKKIIKEMETKTHIFVREI